MKKYPKVRIFKSTFGYNSLIALSDISLGTENFLDPTGIFLCIHFIIFTILRFLARVDPVCVDMPGLIMHLSLVLSYKLTLQLCIYHEDTRCGVLTTMTTILSSANLFFWLQWLNFAYLCSQDSLST